ncbi:carbohydrate ABC transporter permease [Paenibacillus thalictri]|uniref:carbohydrate ABC transporter permease n=1 Tax=Paenibacillus thalictri TaxID=2527873 RepID=UPI001F0E3714|nr:carbohydrate ABC transporter permease [Paenibacillus thalictri]
MLKNRWFDGVNTVFLLLVAVITFYPLWHELSLSFSSMEEAMKGGAFLWPRAFTTAAYHTVLGSDYIWVAYRNSVFSTVAGTLIGVLLTAMTAYPLTKQEMPAKNVILFLVLFTMLFSGGMIPTYLLVKQLGLINSLWSLILPTAISAFNVIIMLSFFRTLPAELEDSAMIDGANPLRIFFGIVMPLSKPVLATVALWEAVGIWNNYLNAVIYLNDKSKYTLPLLLRDVINGQITARMTGELTGSSVDSVVAATIIVAVVPVLCVYPYLQKYFVKGVMIGSVKS